MCSTSAELRHPQGEESWNRLGRVSELPHRVPGKIRSGLVALDGIDGYYVIDAEGPRHGRLGHHRRHKEAVAESGRLAAQCVARSVTNLVDGPADAVPAPDVRASVNPTSRRAGC